MRSRTSAKDVAELAGVSRAAVSRTFGGGQVSENVRERVLAAAEKLGYRPNAIARSLIGGKTNLVAVVTAGHDSIHNTMLIERLIVAITRRGKRALVLPATPDAGIDESILHAADYQVDAIVVIGGTVSPAIIDRLRRFEVPLFLYERYDDDPGLECVTGDNEIGGRLAAVYLARCGHQRIAYVTKSLKTFSNAARREGFVSGLAESGLSLFAETTGEQGFEGGYQAAIRLFSTAELPDAAFCFNDEMAFGVIQAAAVMKLKVPDDIAVIGYDDIPMASWPMFNLTTIHNAVDRPIRILLDRILARCDGDPPREAPHIIKPELVVRGTTL